MTSKPNWKQALSNPSSPTQKATGADKASCALARTLADLDQSDPIQQSHLEEAQRWTASDIYKLERFRAEDFAMRH